MVSASQSYSGAAELDCPCAEVAFSTIAFSAGNAENVRRKVNAGLELDSLGTVGELVCQI